MRRTCFTEEQIIGVRREHEAGLARAVRLELTGRSIPLPASRKSGNGNVTYSGFLERRH